MIFIVLGMHKSGTTLISKILHDSGIMMLESSGVDGGYDAGNKMERASAKMVNNAILGSNNKFSLDITMPKKLNFGDVQQNMMRQMIQICADSNRDWGFKDPRTCLTYSLWRAHLESHRLVFIFRSPEEVWSHYWASARFYEKPKIFFKFIRRWCEYNSSGMLSALQSKENPCIFISYSELMASSKEWDRLQMFVGRQLHDSRSSKMYRQRSSIGKLYKLALALHLIFGGDDPNILFSKLSNLRSTQFGG